MLENASRAFGDTRVSTHVRLFIEATRHNQDYMAQLWSSPDYLDL